MTREEKQLLLKDLCARMPYGVICDTPKGDGHLCSINQTIFGTEYGINVDPVKRDYFGDSEQEEQIIKPYLRPMSSLVGKELDECRATCKYRDVGQSVLDCATIDTFNWLNEKMFDYRGIIEKGLALEAHEGMYKTE